MSDEFRSFREALLGSRAPLSDAERIELELGRGQAAAMQGVFLILCSAVLYCVVAFRGGANLDIAQIMAGEQPLAAAALLGIAAGAVWWIFGCAVYLSACMEAEE